MANKMLIDAAHPEETRVVVVRGQRVEEFDFESAQRKPLRGNIYLAKVMRVEPSLQAAFVDYGGNRHGFLAFSEIHPDYYQIPVADREALIAEEARSARESDDDEPGPRRNRGRRGAPMAARGGRGSSISRAESENGGDAVSEEPLDREPVAEEPAERAEAAPEGEASLDPMPDRAAAPSEDDSASNESSAESGNGEFAEAPQGEAPAGFPAADAADETASVSGVPETAGSGREVEARHRADSIESADASESAEPMIEHMGAGDGLEEVPERRRPVRRNYKIQEVIKRRQILLVQVVKEERGNKGAALTTYLSLAGRYSVLMPNTARGGGISRKITNAPDRKRLKSVAQELDVPNGMGVIVRTAGAARTKAEIKRDFEYLLRLWENVRELTLKSSAPALVHEEGSLIKRAIRDLYNKDIDEILVAGEEGYKEAKDFMRMLAPSHAKAVKLDKETDPVFARFGVERQLDAMFSNIVTLRSGGYVVINQTEALVAIDVNSGRATREHNIEDTALKTNLEAAEEVARQLRLRDLAGLIVIDFIDMDEKRNNRSVEKRLKDCLKNDRARIQVGSISPFGLLEMSRQRIRSGVVEGSSTPCPHCAGAGRVRSTPSVALHVLRHVEDALVKNASRNLIVKTRTDIALYILNQKRRHLRQIEDRFGVSVNFVADDKHNGVDFFAVEFGEPIAPRSEAASFETEGRQPSFAPARVDEDEPTDEAVKSDGEAREESEHRSPADGEGSQKRRRRRRRRRGGADRETEGAPAHSASADPHRAPAHDEPESDEVVEAGEAQAAGPGGPPDGTEQPRKRRRGRRGGRARREDGDFTAPQSAAASFASEAERHQPLSGSEAETVDEHEPDTAEMKHAEVGREPSAPRNAHLEASPPEGEPRNGAEIEAETEPGPEDAPQREEVASAQAESSTTTSDEDSAPAGNAPSAKPEPEPVLASTYDPARAKRAGWWSKARTAMGGKE
jgi:ribonuclease E